MVIFIWIMKENAIATNFEPHEYIIVVQSTKTGTHENKAIHSKTYSLFGLENIFNNTKVNDDTLTFGLSIIRQLK